MRFVLILILLMGVAVDLAALEVPYLSARVNDLAELLDDAAETHLNSSLDSLQKSTGAQLVVLTIPSLQREVLEDYSMRVVETWKLGRKGVDDGVLLLDADHRVVMVNDTLRQTFSVEEKEVLGSEVDKLFRDEDILQALWGSLPVPLPSERGPGPELDLDQFAVSSDRSKREVSKCKHT